MTENHDDPPTQQDIEKMLQDYATRYEQLLQSKRNLVSKLQKNISEEDHESQSSQIIQTMASVMAQNAAMNGMLTCAIESCRSNVRVNQDVVDGLQCLLYQSQWTLDPSSLFLSSSSPFHSQLLKLGQKMALDFNTEFHQHDDSPLEQPYSYQEDKEAAEASLNDFFDAHPELEKRHENATESDEDERWIDILDFKDTTSTTACSSSRNYTLTRNNIPTTVQTQKQQQQDHHPLPQYSKGPKTPSSSWDTYTTADRSSNGEHYQYGNSSSVPPAATSATTTMSSSSAFRTASELKMNSNPDHSKDTTDHLSYPTTNPYSMHSTTIHSSFPIQSHNHDPEASSSSNYNPNRPHLTAGLKKKFQLPKPRMNMNSNHSNTQSAPLASTSKRQTNTSNTNQDDELPEELQHLDAELVRKIENEICDSGEPITFQDIAGLKDAKQTVMELVCWPMKRPDLFTGLRRGPNGLLLFGPPGTGKTLIGKAIAHESGATFFSISSSSLTSKWIGEGEKLVRTLFAVAAYREPAVVFIDEIDSLLTQRKADENEASRRIKTEFLVQLDGTGTSGQGRVLVIGATNRPQELDDAARRRFVKRLYIPLPEAADREILLRTLLAKNHNSLTDRDIAKLSIDTNGFSGADLKALCTDAALGPIRQLGNHALEVAATDVPPISYKHFRHALKGMNPSVAQSDLVSYLDFNRTYGSKSVSADDYDSLSDDDDNNDADNA